MNSYFYIEARTVEGLLSFREVRVIASSKREAYDTGAKKIRKLTPNEHSKGKFENDFVVGPLLVKSRRPARQG